MTLDLCWLAENQPLIQVKVQSRGVRIIEVLEEKPLDQVQSLNSSPEATLRSSLFVAGAQTPHHLYFDLNGCIHLPLHRVGRQCLTNVMRVKKTTGPQGPLHNHSADTVSLFSSLPEEASTC